MNNSLTRRGFLGAASAAATWMATAPQARARGANEAVHLGLIGCGGRGHELLHNFLREPAARMVAVCDLHSGRMAHARAAAGGSRIKTYHDYRQLLADKDIDAVIIATTGHWHVLTTIHACQAGKDVYVEKPLGTSIVEGRAAVQAARKYNRIVQIGTQQRSWEHYQRAVEVVQSGRLGEISEVQAWDYENQSPGYGTPPDGRPPAELDWEFWLGPAPQHAYNPNRFLHHYWYFDYGGGWPLDWAVHHYDIIHWAMGVKWPAAATALGGHMALTNDSREWPDTFDGVLQYGPGPVARRGFLLRYTFRAGCRREERCHAKLFCGTEASLLLDRSGYTLQAELRNGKKVVAETFRGKGENHAEVFLRNVGSRARPLADVEEGHHSSNPGHLMNIAWRVGRQIRWDGEREMILDDPAASRLLGRSYRRPWRLEV